MLLLDVGDASTDLCEHLLRVLQTTDQFGHSPATKWPLLFLNLIIKPRTDKIKSVRHGVVSILTVDGKKRHSGRNETKTSDRRKGEGSTEPERERKMRTPQLYPAAWFQMRWEHSILSRPNIEPIVAKTTKKRSFKSQTNREWMREGEETGQV